MFLNNIAGVAVRPPGASAMSALQQPLTGNRAMQASPADQSTRACQHRNSPQLACCGSQASHSDGMSAEPPASPQEALKRLYAGNIRFAQGKSLAINRDLKRIKAIAASQSPFAAFLGCADSRVPIEII